LLVLPDAVDLRQFSRPAVLPPSSYAGDRPNAVYAGHLYDYKGIPTVLQAAAALPEVAFHLVGGWDEDIARQRARAAALGLKNVEFHGMKHQAELPPYLWHADVLLLPPSAHHPSAAWTSPLKLGEYLAAGVPVVATDIPALRDWVTHREVEFVAADDPAALATGVNRMLKDRPRATELRINGPRRAAQLTYAKRAERVLPSMQSGHASGPGPGRNLISSA
jgi:glycosyltransferase involved in cell wall biosynthesis